MNQSDQLTQTPLNEQKKSVDASDRQQDALSLDASNKKVIGESEYINISLGNSTMKARIDTGAKSTSIAAINIREFERDGEKWIKFDIPNNQGKLTPVTTKVVGMTRIKRHGEASIKRPIVMAAITLGDVKQHIKVNLADRKQFEFPALVGRNFLDGKFIVDASKKYTQGLPKP